MAPGLCRRPPSTELRRVTTHPTDQAPEDRDGDLLDWLGFAPGASDDRPLLTWPRPAGWPSTRRAPRGRHRVVRPRAA